MDSQRIVRDPGILGGKPVIRGARISVELVLQYLAQDLDAHDVLEAYPHITPEDVRACVEYARALVDADARQALELTATG